MARSAAGRLNCLVRGLCAGPGHKLGSSRGCSTAVCNPSGRHIAQCSAPAGATGHPGCDAREHDCSSARFVRAHTGARSHPGLVQWAVFRRLCAAPLYRSPDAQCRAVVSRVDFRRISSCARELLTGARGLLSPSQPGTYVRPTFCAPAWRPRRSREQTDFACLYA